MITIVVGAQYGGEGKGKISALLAKESRFDIVCRTGGVNSSHTVQISGRTYRLRMLPTSSVVDNTAHIVFGAGSLIHIKTLLEEIKLTGFPVDRIFVDPRAGIVTEECVDRQRADHRYSQIGSTLTGTGYASAERCMRRLPLAREFPEMRNFMLDTVALLYKSAQHRKRILLEGHQGAGLSNYHGDYPYVSSRDCTAAALLSEVGLPPSGSVQTVLVVKLFPTRNHNGDLPNELTAQEACALGINEHGGGSWGIEDRRRRVGRLNYDDIRRAVLLNGPRWIALTGLDYFDPAARDKTSREQLSRETQRFVSEFEEAIGVPVSIVSTGEGLSSAINWREDRVAEKTRGAPRS